MGIIYEYSEKIRYKCEEIYTQEFCVLTSNF